MREIKFRGWHKDAESMVYFGLGEDNIPCEGKDGEIFKFMIEYGHPVMQFTGLHDKDGKEIYEGDIIRLTYIKCEGGGWKSNSKEQGVVYFDSTWGVKFDCKDRTQRTADTHWKVKSGRFNDATDVEVIGNIHENPELLNA